MFPQSSFDRESVDVGNVGMAVTNVGTIGRPDVRNDPLGPPSLEYPINSGIEHLFEGGLWIGALVNGQTAVSTGSIDAPAGYATGGSGFEMTAEVGNQIAQRSSLTGSDFFSFDAISHQDYLVDFTDKNVIVPGTTIQIANHDLPLGADVHLETYAWNYSFADFFVILNYQITNNSTNTWDSVYLGMWTDLVVRNINVATDAGAAFFNKGGGGFIDSCDALYAFDVAGDPGFTNSYASTCFLGVEWRDLLVHPENKDTLVALGYPIPNVYANFWNFRTFDGTQFGSPANDVEAYAKMRSDHNWSDPLLVESIQAPSNRIQLLSVGPLKEVLPGESLNYVLAMVCARQLETGGSTGPTMDTEFARTELVDHLGWAKRTYNGEDVNVNGVLDAGEDLDNDNILDRYILPEPPATPTVKIVPSSNQIDVYWNNAAEFSVDPISKKIDFEGYRIYRTQLGEDFELDVLGAADVIAEFDKPGNAVGFNNGFDAVKLAQPVTFQDDTITYHYRFTLDNVLNGWQYVVIVTSFDEGDDELQIPSLESSLVGNALRVFPGTPATAEQEIGVYPNPLRLGGAWDGASAKTQKIYFYNLPQRCEVTIYTVSGEVITTLFHDGATYVGDDSQWFAQFAGDQEDRIMPGGEHAWDLLTSSGQSIRQGLYLFSVKDLETDEVKTGRFAVLK